MSRIADVQIKEIDFHMENGDYLSAARLLDDLSEKYPDEGIVPYYLGRLSMIVKDEELAIKYFLAAEKKGYNITELYISLGMLLDDYKNTLAAEKYFIKACEMADTNVKKLICLSALAVFYIKQEQYTNADRIAKQMISDYPDTYQGYHIYVLKESVKGNLKEMNVYLENLQDKFKRQPQYLIDYIEIMKQQGRTSELMELFDNDQNFMEIIPQIVLREKIAGLKDYKIIEEKEKLIRELAISYQDSDAIVSLMILEFSKKNFKKSAGIANIILENENKIQGIRYYLALYFQIFNFYYLADKKPSIELKKWIEKAGDWCINFINELEIPDLTEVVYDSIQDLFNEINGNF